MTSAGGQAVTKASDGRATLDPMWGVSGQTNLTLGEPTAFPSHPVRVSWMTLSRPWRRLARTLQGRRGQGARRFLLSRRSVVREVYVSGMVGSGKLYQNSSTKHCIRRHASEDTASEYASPRRCLWSVRPGTAVWRCCGLAGRGPGA